MPLNDDRSPPVDPPARAIERRQYDQVAALPIISAHGHSVPCWYAQDAPFSDPAQLCVATEHHCFRILCSQGAALEDLDVPTTDGVALETDERANWRPRAARTAEREPFRGQMLTKWRRSASRGGMVMQIHPGGGREHARVLVARFGRAKGADMSTQTAHVAALKPLQDRFGAQPGLTALLCTLDEDASARAMAPLAGADPCLRLGPPCWFHDSPRGMRRRRERVIETADFDNTTGFNGDTRAYGSTPARHGMARRCDSAHLAGMVAEHQLDEGKACDIAHDLAHGPAKAAYRV